MLWERLEGDGLALHVWQQIPETHEQQKPSDQTEKPDSYPGFPAGNYCHMPPGVAAARLITNLSLLKAAVSVPDIY